MARKLESSRARVAQIDAEAQQIRASLGRAKADDDEPARIRMRAQLHDLEDERENLELALAQLEADARHLAGERAAAALVAARAQPEREERAVLAAVSGVHQALTNAAKLIVPLADKLPRCRRRRAPDEACSGGWQSCR